MKAALHRVLSDAGIPLADLHTLPTSTVRFSDGGQYRIEIPSTEGPEGLSTVLDEAERLEVPIHRISQGSGVFMLTDRELHGMADLARHSAIELSLFARPNAGWGPSAAAMSEAGGVFAPLARGAAQLAQCIDDIERAADAGVRNVLIGDIGVLAAFQELRIRGALPPEMHAKISVMMPAANPSTARVFAAYGANSLNLPTDLDLAQIAAIRSAVDVPLDIYVEAPSNLGGFVQLHLIPEIIRIAAPVYIKFGLRNGPDIYPMGAHLRGSATEMSRERVRRARLGLELLARSGSEARMSPVGSPDLRIPVADPADAAPLPTITHRLDS